MKDHADKTWLQQPLVIDTLEYKRQAAKQLLDKLGINRASVHCNHQYTDSNGRTIHLTNQGAKP